MLSPWYQLSRVFMGMREPRRSEFPRSKEPRTILARVISSGKKMPEVESSFDLTSPYTRPKVSVSIWYSPIIRSVDQLIVSTLPNLIHNHVNDSLKPFHLFLDCAAHPSTFKTYGITDIDRPTGLARQ